MQNTKPTVTIIIPTYNHAHFLKECIQSIIDQTYQNWEAIIINNYSKDNTIEIVERFNDPRIHIINFKNYGIIAASRNEGIRLANTDIIAFLDSDDTWYLDKLEQCLKEFNIQCDLLCHGLLFKKSNRPWKKIYCGPEKRATYNELLFKGSCIITSAVMVRKECLIEVGMFDEKPSIVTSEDLDLWINLAQKGFKFRFLNQILGEYAVHENNASSAVIKHMNSRLEILNKHFKYVLGNKYLNSIQRRKTEALIYYGAGRQYQQNHQYKNALTFFRKSLASFPFFLRAYAGIALTFLSISDSS